MWACTFGLPDTNSSPYIVGISGFEPKPAESESAVLTIIHYIPLCDLCNLIHISQFNLWGHPGMIRDLILIRDKSLPVRRQP